jgi:hypothetical protein
MKYPILILFSAVLLIVFSCKTQDTKWQTWYEAHDKNETPRYDETITYCKRLADASPMLRYEVIGTSHQGRDIPVLIFDTNKNFTPSKVRKSGNKIVMIQAAIHPGEPVGKDAGLLLLRDIVIHGKYHEFLDNITILFLPVLNPDGHERFGPYNRINQDGPNEMGWRTNSLNLNLNRDYLKADSREIRSFLSFYHQWEPDFYIDTHSTNGGDYQYPMTYAMGIYGEDEAYPALTTWIKEFYVPEIEKKMDYQGYPIFPYVTYRNWHDPRSGLRSGVGHPMYSNSYVAELNRPGLLLEAHMLKPYHIRVESTYYMILHTLRILHQDKQLKNIIAEADKFTSSDEFRKHRFPIRYENTSDSVIVDFLGVEYNRITSDLTGGNWFIYEPDKPVTYQIPWFNKNRVIMDIEIPDAYIIPVEYFEIIKILDLHGIEMTILESATQMQVQSYKFSEVALSARSTEGRQTASFHVEPIEETRLFPKGSAIVSTAQPRVRLLIHALEPMAPGSFAYWGFFNAVFERVEYFESYVMEKMAREMLAEDPALAEQFKKAMEENPSMAQNSNAILTWFYERTPYYDQKYLVYPVGKIINH